jgi:hypothetical protein
MVRPVTTVDQAISPIVKKIDNRCCNVDREKMVPSKKRAVAGIRFERMPKK